MNRLELNTTDKYHVLSLNGVPLSTTFKRGDLTTNELLTVVKQILNRLEIDTVCYVVRD